LRRNPVDIPVKNTGHIVRDNTFSGRLLPAAKITAAGLYVFLRQGNRFYEVISGLGYSIDKGAGKF
jgi:hypothetical protein